MTTAHVEAREKKAPLWAVLAPVVYLLACGVAARAVFRTQDDAGVAGLLAAVGLCPAFVIPAVFTTCKVRLSVADGGLLIAGRLLSETAIIDDCRLERAPRGGALLHVTTSAGQLRTFVLASFEDGRALVARLPRRSGHAIALAM